jgi:FkbM family methyltransferase
MEFRVDTTDDGYGSEYWRNIENGSYEIDTFTLISKYSASKKIFVDIGAANGAISIFAAKLGYKVISIEANRDVFQVLQRNITLNSDITKLIHLENSVLVSREDLNSSQNIFKEGLLTEISRSGSSIDAFKNSKLIDIDSIFEIYKNTQYFLKIDIEGSEWRLFNSKSFMNAIRRHDVIMLVALHPGLNRPLELLTKKKYLKFLPKKTLWRLLVIKDSMKFHSQLNEFSICRTNGATIRNRFKFLALMIGGYHEYLIEIKTKNN